MKRISQRDIAKKLGVNVSTVSGALNGQKGVSTNLEEIFMIGYMSDWISDMTSPKMSFVKQNLKEIGTKAFRLLQDQLEGDDRVKCMVVKAHLEIRESTKKITE